MALIEEQYMSVYFRGGVVNCYYTYDNARQNKTQSIRIVNNNTRTIWVSVAVPAPPSTFRTEVAASSQQSFDVTAPYSNYTPYELDWQIGEVY